VPENRAASVPMPEIAGRAPLMAQARARVAGWPRQPFLRPRANVTASGPRWAARRARCVPLGLQLRPPIPALPGLGTRTEEQTAQPAELAQCRQQLPIERREPQAAKIELFCLSSVACRDPT